jgi:hypothetical protein
MRWWHHVCVAAAIAAATSLPYLNTLPGAPCYDDKVAILGNPDVVQPTVDWAEFMVHDFWGNDILRRRPGGWTHDSWRPLTTLTFRWNYAAGARDFWWYHVVNIGVHALTVVCAYALAARLARGGARAEACRGATPPWRRPPSG